MESSSNPFEQTINKLRKEPKRWVITGAAGLSVPTCWSIFSVWIRPLSVWIIFQQGMKRIL